MVGGRRRTHKSLGWREADGTSYLGEFVAQNCLIMPDVSLSLWEFLREFKRTVPDVDAARATTIMRRRFMIEWDSTQVSLQDGPGWDQDELIRGLDWAD